MLTNPEYFITQTNINLKQTDREGRIFIPDNIHCWRCLTKEEVEAGAHPSTLEEEEEGEENTTVTTKKTQK